MGIIRPLYGLPFPLVKPTETGKVKWEPDGYYDGEPCTCKPDCPSACKGECGCKACHTAYQDFLSDE